MYCVYRVYRQQYAAIVIYKWFAHFKCHLGLKLYVMRKFYNFKCFKIPIINANCTNVYKQWAVSTRSIPSGKMSLKVITFSAHSVTVILFHYILAIVEKPQGDAMENWEQVHRLRKSLLTLATLARHDGQHCRVHPPSFLLHSLSASPQHLARSHQCPC